MLEHERRERSIDVLSCPSAQFSHLVLGEELDHPCECLSRHRDETEPIGVHVPLDESAEGLVRQKTDADSFPLRPLTELAVDHLVDSKCSRRRLSTLHSDSHAETARGSERLKKVCVCLSPSNGRAMSRTM